MEYEDRVVIFIDILGFRDRIKRTIDKNGDPNFTEINKIYSALSTIQQEVTTQQSVNPNLSMTHFSDSLVISFDANDPDNFINGFETIKEMLYKLVENSFLCRGGAAFGKIVHTDKLVFGPALIKAYDAESKASFYPRIIIDSSIMDLAEKVYNEVYYNSTNIEMNNIERYVNLDADGLHYIDYFGKADIPGYPILVGAGNLEMIIRTGLGSDEPDIRVKYGWMKTKFNDRVRETKDYIKNISDPEKKKQAEQLTPHVREIK